MKHTFSRKTTLIVAQGTIVETQVGFGWNDAIEAIWSGEHVAPLQVLDLDTGGVTVSDRTKLAVEQIAERTFDEGHTPRWLLPLFDAHDVTCFDEERHAHMLRNPNQGLALGAQQLGVGHAH